MKSKTRVLRRPTKAIKELEKISKSFKGGNSVKVGLPKGSNDYPDGTSVIMVGTVHEFGSPAQGIPQRSFLRSTVTSNRRKYRDLLKKLAKKVIDGKFSMKKALGVLGLTVQTDVRENITDLKTPPLQYREGNPLLLTGHLRQSITYEVDE